MSRLLRVSFCTVSLVIIAACGRTRDDESARRQALISSSIVDAMTAYYVPGVSVAVIHNFSIDWAQGYGTADVKTGTPVDRHTLFPACRVSSVVSTMAVLSYADEGMIRLDDPVNDYLVSWRLPPGRSAAGKPVTVRSLLSHTAGITVADFPGYKQDDELPTLLQILDGEAPALSPPVRVDAEPGSGFRFSSGGFAILQQALVDITKKAFPAVMKARVLMPLDMYYSTFDQPLPESLVRFTAAGHRPNGDPSAERLYTYPEAAAAGLWTTPEDLAQCVIEIQKSLTDDSGRVLSRESAQMMTELQIFSGFGIGVALTERDGRCYFGLEGSQPGFTCSFTASASGGFGIVIMTNGGRGIQLAQEIIRKTGAVYGW